MLLYNVYLWQIILTFSDTKFGVPWGILSDRIFLIDAYLSYIVKIKNLFLKKRGWKISGNVVVRQNKGLRQAPILNPWKRGIRQIF